MTTIIANSQLSEVVSLTDALTEALGDSEFTIFDDDVSLVIVSTEDTQASFEIGFDPISRSFGLRDHGPFSKGD